MTSRLPDRLRERLAGTPRLVLAVVLLLAGTLVALTATAPPATAPVLVATRDVPAGTALTAADLTVARRAAADRPEGALADPAPAVGHRVVAALGRGEVVTGLRLAPTGLTGGLPPGRAIATVAVAPARAGVVVVGDTVRLVVASGAGSDGSDPSGSTPDPGVTPVTLADDARVRAIWPAAPGGTGTGDTATTLVVDVDVGSAARLAVLPSDLLVGIVLVTA